MIPGFEIDCGEVLEGHRLLATGLRVDGMSDDHALAEYSEHSPGEPVHPMVSLTYVIVPGLGATPTRGRDVDAEVRIEPPADPSWWATVTSWGGERDATVGAEVTAGAFGPFVLPEGTQTVTIDLINIGISTNDMPPEDDSPHRRARFASDRPRDGVGFLAGRLARRPLAMTAAHHSRFAPTGVRGFCGRRRGGPVPIPFGA